jgi:transcriptional regulator with XRE-family HTH domain
MIHAQLLQARLDQKLSRGDLAKLSGVPRERLRQIEGGANFTLETLLKLLPHLPNLKTIYLGSVELRAGGEIEAAALRDELAGWLESGRRLLTMFEKIEVAPRSSPATSRGTPEISADLESRLRQLEGELAQIRAADRRES